MSTGNLGYWEEKWLQSRGKSDAVMNGLCGLLTKVGTAPYVLWYFYQVERPILHQVSRIDYRAYLVQENIRAAYMHQSFFQVWSKVPIKFLGTGGFSLRMDGRYWCKWHVALKILHLLKFELRPPPNIASLKYCDSIVPLDRYLCIPLCLPCTKPET